MEIEKMETSWCACACVREEKRVLRRKCVCVCERERERVRECESKCNRASKKDLGVDFFYLRSRSITTTQLKQISCLWEFPFLGTGASCRRWRRRCRCRRRRRRRCRCCRRRLWSRRPIFLSFFLVCLKKCSIDRRRPRNFVAICRRSKLTWTKKPWFFRPRNTLRT